MRFTLFASFILSLFFSEAGFANGDYRYSVDLTNVKNDRLTVNLVPPDIETDEVDFIFPAMVPGTYEVYNFGRFVSNFKATGKDGAKIEVKKMDQNTYRLSHASKLASITYDVDDTFDKCGLPGTSNKIIFEPAGTNFEAGKNFALNTFGLFGYFGGLSSRKFILEFQKPDGFYPSTGLEDIQLGANKDVISVFDYHDLADSPILYFKPDTATVNVANTRVLVSCYSPNRKLTAGFIAATLKEVLYAQRDYLGGALPVDKYAFLFYFNSQPTLSGSNGALEHSYSSFYVMPEVDSTFLKQQLRDVAAHEFFHIVTPLTIHAEEIGNFDFNKPRMSEHLWLYEGMTEYAAHHAQAKAGIITIDDLVNVMMQKYNNSLTLFNDTMSFTYMSRHVLEPKIHTQYNNVYEKGALIGMCLDIMLRDLSGGAYGTQNLMKDLAKKYGKNKSFNDEELFNDIEKLTYPEIGTFLRKHVGGGEPLPMEDIFARIGISFVKEKVSYEYSLGSPELGLNQSTGRLFVMSVKNLDEIGRELGYKKNDELLSVNGKQIKVETLKETISEFYASMGPGSKIQVEVRRKSWIPGLRKIKVLKADAKKVKTTRQNKLSLMENTSDRQKTTIKSWIGIK